MTNPPLSGQRFGAYDVGPLIGAGGMGEVYRARDAKLNRDVAIKVLLSAVVNDPDRLARFRREAQTLASLNHPGIAQIHGLEDSPSGPFLVMELVDGPTLADRIAAGALPVDEAIAVARQIVDALEAAHERGIIHRDLKPANIKIRDDGTVKILDFGLAKALDPQAGVGAAGPMANSPTITTPAMTQAGLILGTAAYMSPEQAKGRVVDKRTDVWAFGCVFYEMLTARRAFDGEDVTDTIAAVVRGEPDWSALPNDTPSQIRLLLKRCLDKDRRTRIGDISVARFLLNERIESATSSASAAAAEPARRRRWPVAAAALLGLAIGALAMAVAAWNSTAPPRSSTARFEVTPSPAHPLIAQGNDRDLAMAPDGSFIVYRSSDGGRSAPQLAIRALNELEERLIAGSNFARSPTVSPDGRWIAFAAQGELRKVAVAGGPPTALCKLPGAVRGLSWGDDGTIVFATSQVPALQRVSAGGGNPQPFTKPEPGIQHLYPSILPGSEVVLYTATTGSAFSATVEVVSVKTGQQKRLINGGHDATYVDGGFIVYATSTPGGDGRQFDGALRAARFNLSRLEIEGDSISAVDQVAIGATGVANYSLSRRGDLVYLPSEAVSPNLTAKRTLVWVDRRGIETPIPAPPRTYAVARISPDGGRAALDMRDQTNDIWIWDFTRQTLTPLNLDPAQDLSPIWLPGGRTVVWASTRGSTTPNLYRQAADGTGAPERLTTHSGNQFPTSVTPDGKQIIFFGSNLAQQLDVFRIDLGDGDRKPQTLVSTGPFDLGGELSPDGRWLAYYSNESGEYQVYVRPFPNVQEGRYPISTDGGTRAAWSRRGDELFYLDNVGSLMAVKVKAQPNGFSASVPAKLFNTAYYLGESILGIPMRAYDVAPDGQRFLMIKETAPGGAPPASPGMVVVLNWPAELESRLTTR